MKNNFYIFFLRFFIGKRIIYFICIGLFFTSCTASRTIINSGKVTTKGDIKIGVNQSANIPTQTISATGGVLVSAVQAAMNMDSIKYDEQVDKFSKAVLAYSLDPLSTSFDFYIRYGLLKRVDVGYKFFFGTHVFDAAYQFMGSTGTIKNPGENGLCGSIGIQFASQSSDLPNKLFLNYLEGLLEFKASRKDIMIPLIFSLPIGKEEEYGHFAFGAVYNHSFVEYGFQPTKIFMQYAGNYTNVQLPSVNEKKNFPSFGAFINGKLGYRYVYLLGSMSVFYQNYGNYAIPGGKTIKLSGLTFIPNIGLQVHIHSGKASRLNASE
jgi:hypothetical protein